MPETKFETEEKPKDAPASAADAGEDALRQAGVGSTSASDRANDLLAFANPAAEAKDSKIELSENDFGKIGPKAAEVMKAAGVDKFTVEPGEGFDTLSAHLKKPLEIPQDPAVDNGVRKLKVAEDFKADFSTKPDGTIVLDNIQGLTAEKKIFGSFREADVTRIEISKGPNGNAIIKSTGGIGPFKKTETREKPAEILDKAKLLIDRLQNLKNSNNTKDGKTSSLDLPNLMIG